MLALNPDSPFDVKFDSNLFTAMQNINPDMPIPNILSYSDVKRLSRQRVLHIFANWERLHTILQRYEDVLRKRWMKKTQEQRRNVLLTAWPHMSKTHRPDFQALQRESEQQRRTATRFRDAYLFPYINLEDLSKAKNLLLLLHSRGHNKPDVFAYFDLMMQRIAVDVRAVTISFLGGYSMQLTGETSADTYGRLVSHANPNEASIVMTTAGLGMHPGRGLLVLEVQDKLLSFLVKCTEIILQDIQLDNSIPSTSQIPPPLLTLVLPTDTQWPSVAITASEAPYKVPVQFDFSRLMALVNAKRAEAEDYVWSLREDPRYFQEMVIDYSEHRGENLLTENGRRHPHFNKPIFWEKVFTSVVADAYTMLWMWNLVWKQLSHLAALREKYSSRISLTRKLPVEYEEAFIHFSHLMVRVRNGPLMRLRHSIFASPPLRRCFCPYASSRP